MTKSTEKKRKHVEHNGDDEYCCDDCEAARQADLIDQAEYYLDRR